jgi:hypothetical protein
MRIHFAGPAGTSCQSLQATWQAAQPVHLVWSKWNPNCM